jgi:hypothetical protein
MHNVSCKSAFPLKKVSHISLPHVLFPRQLVPAGFIVSSSSAAYFMDFVFDFSTAPDSHV